MIPFSIPTFCSTCRAWCLRCAVWIVAWTVPTAGFAQLQIQHWDYAAYGVSVRLAIHAPGQLRVQLEQQLPEIVRRRVETSIGPAWKLDIAGADSVLRNQMLRNLEQTSLEQATGDIEPIDKLLLLVVRADGAGFQLQAREYDGYLQRWGATVVDSCQQYAALGERAFALLHETFAPLAKLSIDPEDDDLVLLTPRASAIAAKDPTASWFRKNDVFLPILRRTTRDGQLIENGIQVVPWTYAVAEGVREGQVVARLQSGTKRPLGVRRRGRVEQVAIALRGKPEPVVVKLHARGHSPPSQSQTPLVGYEVHAQNTDDPALSLVGWTDRQGKLTLPVGRTPVQLLFLKNGGEVLARVPVVPGAESVVEIPLPDDGPRLRAEAALNALRENLIDLVARRNILIARTRNQIDQGELKQAKQLFDQLGDLPGRAQFNRALGKQEQLFHSSDPQIQRRINKLFSVTREVLGTFLDIREISDLRTELDDALDAARVASSP